MSPGPDAKWLEKNLNALTTFGPASNGGHTFDDRGICDGCGAHRLDIVEGHAPRYCGIGDLLKAGACWTASAVIGWLWTRGDR